MSGSLGGGGHQRRHLALRGGPRGGGSRRRPAERRPGGPRPAHGRGRSTDRRGFGLHPRRAPAAADGPAPPRYDDLVVDVVRTVTGLAANAVRAGVRPDGLLIDPGHDFGKTTAHSLEVTRRLDEPATTGWPVLVALSNKDFIGETLDLPVSERLVGTLAATTALSGARSTARRRKVPDCSCRRSTTAYRGQR